MTALNDILDNFNKELTEDQKYNFLSEMKQLKVYDLKSNQRENLIMLIISCSDDNKVKDYLLHVVDNEYEIYPKTEKNKIIEKFVSDERFNRYKDSIYEEIKDDFETSTPRRNPKAIPRKLRKKAKKIREKEKKLKKKSNL